ncbi:MAG: branched-chain amino acid ABC transporter permease [Actinobacteria bacterium]|nr:branched-chain amino acid ABC transporter permease [Actinomycetota bacterium]
MSTPVGFWNRNWGFITLAVVALAMPLLVADAYLLSILAFMATRFMVVIGLSLLLGQAGQISLGHAAFVAIGAYGSALLVTRLSMNPWLAMVVAAVLAAGVAGVIGIPTLKLKGHYLAMATLGFGEIVFILLVQLKGLTRGTDGITGIPPLTLGSLDFSQPRLYHVLVWLVALIVFRLALNLSESRVGRSLKALRRSELAAESLGVNASWRKLQVFMISAVFASLAGSFDAHYVQFISPDSYGITFSVILVCSVVIGGFRSVWGALWGTLATVILPEVIKRIHEDAVNLVFGILLILIVVLLPVKSGPLARVAHDVRCLFHREERG